MDDIDDLKLGDFYDPNRLPDYGGPFFALRFNKLIQLDVRGVDNKLIPPWKFYEELRPGTLILANCSLHVFLMENKKKKDHSIEHKVSILITLCIVYF